MYKFRAYQFEWLKVYVATPEVGSVWKKQFASGVTPQNQFSLNLYTSGKFEIKSEANGFSQVLGLGESSLDIQLSEFPTECLVLETPIDGPACRWCLSVDGGGKWSRVRQSFDGGEMIELTDGMIAAVVPKSGWDGKGDPDVRCNQSFNAPCDCFVFLMRRLTQPLPHAKK